MFRTTFHIQQADFRQVRCDGEISGCSNCSRLGFDCFFLQAQNDLAGEAGPNIPLGQWQATTLRHRTKYTIGGIERRRGLRACRPCRASKSRCSGALPKCRHCEQRGLDCQYLPSKRRKIPVDSVSLLVDSNTDPTASTSSGIQPLKRPEPVRTAMNFSQLSSVKDMGLASDKMFLESHINAYFEYFHTIPQFSFLHQASFLRGFHRDTVDPLVLRCVCGIASRFISPNSDETYVSQWLEEVEAQIWSRTANMIMQNLQLIVLLLCWYSLARKPSHIWTTSAIATRMAFGIRLNHETTDEMPFVLKESRRRLMWAIFMFDKGYAGGLSELTLCAANTIHINLPCEQRNFDLDIPIDTSVLEPFRQCVDLEKGVGIMGHITRLMNIRHAVLE